MRNLTFLFVVLTILNVTTAQQFSIVTSSNEIKCQPIGSSTSATISFTVTSKDDPPPNITGLVMLFDFGTDSFTVKVPDVDAPVLGQAYNYTKEYTYKKNGIFKTRIGIERYLVGGRLRVGTLTIADMLMGVQGNCEYNYVFPTQTPSQTLSQTPTAAPSAAPSSQMMHWFPILLISFMMTCALI